MTAVLIGFAIGLGTTKLWFVADIILILWTAWRISERQGFRTHPVVLALAALVGITAVWSPDPSAALLAAVRLTLLYSLAAGVALRRFWVAVFLVLAAQLIVATVQLPDLARIHGLSQNASQFGQTGLVLFATPLAPVGAVMLGLSTARAAAMGLIIYAFWCRSRRIFAWAAVAAALFLVVMIWKTPDRLTVAGVGTGLAWRGQLNAGEATPQELEEELKQCGPARGREWHVVGYGYHGYCASTGLQRPHNVLVVSWYEFGVLAIPLWALVGAGAWKLRRNGMVLAILAVAMITEEFYARPEAAYMLALSLGFKGPCRVSDEAGDPHNPACQGDGENGIHTEQVDRDVGEADLEHPRRRADR